MQNGAFAMRAFCLILLVQPYVFFLFITVFCRLNMKSLPIIFLYPKGEEQSTFFTFAV